MLFGVLAELNKLPPNNELHYIYASFTGLENFTIFYNWLNCEIIVIRSLGTEFISSSSL
jgi:hypothetical protein